MVSTPVLVLAVAVGGCGPAPVPAPVAPAPQPTDPQVTSPSHRETVGPDDPVDPDAVARAAVLFASCAADDQPHSTASSLYGGRPYERGWLMDLRAELLCLARSTDGCEAVRRCLGIDARRVADCHAGCDGAVATGCDDGLQYRMDCARWGESCDAERGRCARIGNEPCDADRYPGQCTDGRPAFCTASFVGGASHVYRGPRCADLGLECEGDMGVGELAVCKGTGGDCDTMVWSGMSADVEQGRCIDADMLDACVNGGFRQVSCAALAPGFRCLARPGGQPSDRCGLADECDPAGGERARCEGEAVVFCNAGRLERVSCPALGFARCDESLARCAPGLWAL